MPIYTHTHMNTHSQTDGITHTDGIPQERHTQHTDTQKNMRSFKHIHKHIHNDVHATVAHTNTER